jgi:hypothetical protein
VTRCRSAKGSVINDPPKFLQKIKVGTGMVLSAISGPDDPIPNTPIISRIRSGRAGNWVWLSIPVRLFDFPDEFTVQT